VGQRANRETNLSGNEIVMYHVSHQGQQFGPYTVEQINQYLAQGAFDASSHVWDANANGWIEIWQLPGVVLDDANSNAAMLIVILCGIGIVILCFMYHVLPPISLFVGMGAGIIFILPFFFLAEHANGLHKRGAKGGAWACEIAMVVIALIILLYVYQFLSDKL
jgi:hypothetical protein